MIKVVATNFGPVKEIDVTLRKFNLISGKNGTGKSFFVRLLYAVLSVLPENENNREEIQKKLAKKLRWIFQQRNLGSIVNKMIKKDMQMQVETTTNLIEFSISRNSKRKITLLEYNNLYNVPYGNCIFLFLPSILDIELALANYREHYKNNLGVSDIFWDALQTIRTVGIADEIELKSIFKKIEKIIGGKFLYKDKEGMFFKEKDKEYDIKLTASGIKLFGFLQLLIERNLLKKDSILIIEEPECNLHPSYIFEFVDVIKELVEENVYVILVTHSTEIIRYSEYLLNTGQLSPSDMCFILFKKQDRVAFVESGNNQSILLEMLKELTEQYFDLVFKEAKEIEY